MEPEVRLFLKTIVQTVSLTLIWMLLNTFFGIKLGLLFFDGPFSVWQIVYYVLLIATFILLLRYLLKLWKKVPKFGLSDSQWPSDDNT